MVRKKPWSKVTDMKNVRIYAIAVFLVLALVTSCGTASMDADTTPVVAKADKKDAKTTKVVKADKKAHKTTKVVKSNKKAQSAPAVKAEKADKAHK